MKSMKPSYSNIPMSIKTPGLGKLKKLHGLAKPKLKLPTFKKR